MQKRGLVYHIPGMAVAAPDKVWALIPHLHGQGIQRRDACANGPAGEGGAFFALSSALGDEDLGYFPERQTWVNCGAYWVGWRTDAKPTPADLQRKKLIDGKHVTFADGSTWLVPRMRSFPWVYAFDNSGNRVTECAPAYRQLQDDLIAALNNFVNTSYDDAMSLVARGIAINYRIGEGELIALGGVGSSEIFEAFDVMTALDEFREATQDRDNAEKKTELAITPDG